MRSLVTIIAVSVMFSLIPGTVSADPRPLNAPRHPMIKHDNKAAIESLTRALVTLEEMEERLTERKIHKNKKALRMKLKEAQLDVRAALIDVKEMQRILPAYECCPCRVRPAPQVVIVEAPLEPTVLTPPVLDNASFEGLLAEVDAQGFSDDKLGIVRQVSNDTWFTVGQVKALLETMPFSNDKLALLRIVAEQIVDPENKFQLYSSLPHSSDKKKARKILGGE
jgi:Domain of unknown function (DUF4476)